MKQLDQDFLEKIIKLSIPALKKCGDSVKERNTKPIDCVLACLEAKKICDKIIKMTEKIGENNETKI